MKINLDLQHHKRGITVIATRYTGCRFDNNSTSFNGKIVNIDIQAEMVLVSSNRGVYFIKIKDVLYTGGKNRKPFRVTGEIVEMRDLKPQKVLSSLLHVERTIHRRKKSKEIEEIKARAKKDAKRDGIFVTK